MKLLTLNLESETPRAARLSFWPFVDLAAVGLFFLVFGSKFIIAPGLTLSLPELEETHVAIASSYEVITVSELEEGEEVILFQGRILNLDSFSKLLEKRGEVAEGITLLVRADAAVSMQTLSRLAEIASGAGYRDIQIATEQGAKKASAFGR